MKKERVYYFDVLRIVAIFAVVMIHASSDFVSSYDWNTTEFILGNIFDSISRIGVPLFLMISGALMLDETREFDLKKRVVQLVWLFLAWSLFYSVVYSVLMPLMHGETISVSNFISNFIKGHYHLWYMWAIIGLYLLTPILRCFVKIENKKVVLYFIISSLIVAFTSPIIQLLLEEIDIFGISEGVLSAYTYIIEQLNLNFLSGLTAYYLSGWYIANTDINKKPANYIYALGVIGLICTILLTIAFPDKYALTYSNNSIFVFIYSLAVFVLVKKIFVAHSSPNKFVLTLSKLTFGVYLIHVVILSVLQEIFVKNVFFMPVIWLLTIIISFGFALCVSKIPFIKKFVKA